MLGSMPRTRWIVVGVTLVVAIVIGILYGYLAGVAVALAVPTVLLLVLGTRYGADLRRRDPIARYWEEEGFGSDAARRRER
jgi:hypothetical protein